MQPDSTTRSDATTPSIDFDNNSNYDYHSDAEADGVVIMDIADGNGEPANVNDVDAQCDMSDDIDVVDIDEPAYNNNNIDAAQHHELQLPAPLVVQPPVSAFHNVFRPVIFTTSAIQFDFYMACEQLSNGEYFQLIRFIEANYQRTN